MKGFGSVEAVKFQQLSVFFYMYKLSEHFEWMKSTFISMLL